MAHFSNVGAGRAESHYDADVPAQPRAPAPASRGNEPGRLTKKVLDLAVRFSAWPANQFIGALAYLADKHGATAGAAVDPAVSASHSADRHAAMRTVLGGLQSALQPVEQALEHHLLAMDGNAGHPAGPGDAARPPVLPRRPDAAQSRRNSVLRTMTPPAEAEQDGDASRQRVRDWVSSTGHHDGSSSASSILADDEDLDRNDVRDHDGGRTGPLTPERHAALDRAGAAVRYGADASNKVLSILSSVLMKNIELFAEMNKHSMDFVLRLFK